MEKILEFFSSDYGMLCTFISAILGMFAAIVSVDFRG